MEKELMSNLYHKDIYDFDNPVKSYWEANTNTDLKLEKLKKNIGCLISNSSDF